MMDEEKRIICRSVILGRTQIERNIMEINAYLKPLVKWWRLLAVTTVLALVASSISTLFQPNQYVSRTTLMTGSTILDPNPDSGQIFIAQQLSSIYADMANREPVQAATMEALGIDWLPDYQARVVPNTQLIEISVTDTIPERAQIIADELANQLILQSPALNDTGAGQRKEFIQQQLSSLEVQIQETQNRIDELQANIGLLNSASQIASTEEEINNLTRKLTDLRDNYAALLANSQQGALNILTVVEPANLPTRPVDTNKPFVIGMAGAVGLVLAIAAAYILEYLDRSIKTTSDVERILNYPVIGYLSQLSENGTTATYVASHPNSLAAESFRLLQSNIEFFQAYNAAKLILVTSPIQGNGKTTIAINLALSLALSGQKTIIVDSDLRRPSIHSALKIAKAPGLADVIRNERRLSDAKRSLKSRNIEVLVAGNIPQNITEVIGSKRIAAVLADLRDDFDVVIVDAPPLVIADAYNLAAKVDGVILVLEPGQTEEEQARVIKDQLNRAGARVIGVVFNRISTEDAKTYGDYQYLSMHAPQHYNDYVAKVPKMPEKSASPAKKLLAFFERGDVPQDVTESLEGAFDKFDQQRKSLLNRFRKPPKK
jgi:capsular exopolysaccharide synthesis family protein